MSTLQPGLLRSGIAGGIDLGENSQIMNGNTPGTRSNGLVYIHREGLWQKIWAGSMALWVIDPAEGEAERAAS